jgi:hypothetical protein
MLKNIRASIERFLLAPSYFILFSIYPVFELYAYNVHSVLLVELFRPLFISIFFAILFFLSLQLFFHHAQTSALIVFFIYVAFFYYGHVRGQLVSSNVIVRDDLLAGSWLAVIVLGCALIIRYARHWNSDIVAVTLNLTTIILLLFPADLLAVYNYMLAQPLQRKTDHTVQVEASSASPDIYYIILDAYTRSDAMRNKIGYDNSAFINSLKEMGFYVAECSQSNYGTTSLSLGSSLNMDYLQNLSDAYAPKENSLLYAFKALDSNAVRNTLNGAGYETVAFASGFNWIEWRDADHFLSPSGKGISEFESLLLSSTYSRVLDDFRIVNLNDIYAQRYRQRTRFLLNNFDELLNLPSPKFVFIHIIAPHPPYGLDENGNDIAPDLIDASTGYGNQAKFISTAILPHLQKLINESASPPVIILQGDHGRLESGPEDRMKILNAYYLPGHTDKLYPSISPVNSFRVVLNSYFGTNFPLLADISYYSSATHNYSFAIVPDTCP